jgi:hypothetical protein
MASDQKKRHVVSYDNMSPELAAAFSEKYPKGFNDYLPDLVQYTKPDGSTFYAVTMEIPDAIYLVKITIKKDDADDLARWLEGEEEAANPTTTESTDSAAEEGEEIPDADNISGFQSAEEPSTEDE